jgi:hypothetical protein
LRRSVTRFWGLVGWLGGVIGWNPVATGLRVAIETRDLIIIPRYRAVQLKRKGDGTGSCSIGLYVSERVGSKEKAQKPQAL